MLQEFKAITFDCYGTLIDWERGILDQLRPWLDRSGRRDLSDAMVVETYARLEAACEAETPTALYPAIIEEVHVRLARHWELRPDPSPPTPSASRSVSGPPSPIRPARSGT